MHILKLSFYIIGKRKTFVCVNWLVLKYQHALQYKPVCSSSVRQICTARLPFFSWYITNGFVIGDYSDWYNIMLRFPTYSIYMMYRMTPDTGISTTLIMCTAGTKSAQYISLTYLLGIIRLGGIAWLMTNLNNRYSLWFYWSLMFCTGIMEAEKYGYEGNQKSNNTNCYNNAYTCTEKYQ